MSSATPGSRSSWRSRRGSPRSGRLRTLFEAEHEARYGYHDPAQEIELVTIRVSAFGAAATVELQAAAGLPESGEVLAGPTVLRLAESTILIPADWHGTMTGGGAVMLERST